MAIQSLEDVGIVVEDLAAVTTFFGGLGLDLLGEGKVEGDRVDRVVGLERVRMAVAMLQTPDGHGRHELMTFHSRPRPAPLPPRRTLCASVVRAGQPGVVQPATHTVSGSAGATHPFESGPQGGRPVGVAAQLDVLVAVHP